MLSATFKCSSRVDSDWLSIPWCERTMNDTYNINYNDNYLSTTPRDDNDLFIKQALQFCCVVLQMLNCSNSGQPWLAVNVFIVHQLEKSSVRVYSH